MRIVFRALLLMFVQSLYAAHITDIDPALIAQTARHLLETQQQLISTGKRWSECPEYEQKNFQNLLSVFEAQKHTHQKILPEKAFNFFIQRFNFIDLLPYFSTHAQQTGNQAPFDFLLWDLMRIKLYIHRELVPITGRIVINQQIKHKVLKKQHKRRLSRQRSLPYW